MKVDARQLTTVGQVRLCLVVVAAVCCAAVAFIVLRHDDTVERLNAVAGNNDPTWRREDLYLLDQLTGRSVFGVDGLTPRDETTTRVVVFGDSFTEGTGLRNLDRRWGVLLEEVLEQQWEPGTFEVVIVAGSGASMYTYASWAAEVIEAGGADIVVVGWVVNDVAADGRDVNIHPEFERRARARGADDLVIVDADERVRIEYFEVDNPNERWLEVAVDFVAEAGDVAVFAPLLDHPGDIARVEQVAGLFDEAGYVTASRHHTDQVFATFEPEHWTVTATDRHPGLSLQSAYAADVAATIVANVDGPDNSHDTGPDHTALWATSDVVPHETRVDVTSNQLTVTVGDLTARQCTSTAASGNEQHCVDGQPHMTVGDGQNVAAQHAPCVAVGHPYVHISFDRRTPAGTQVSEPVHHDGTPVEMLGVGYDRWGYERLWVADGPVVIGTIDQPGVLLDSPVTPPWDPTYSPIDVRGVAFVDPAGTCDAETIAAPAPFTVIVDVDTPTPTN